MLPEMASLKGRRTSSSWSSVLATSLFSKWKDWLFLKLLGSSFSMWGKVPKAEAVSEAGCSSGPTSSLQAPEWLAATADPSSQRDPQCRTRTAPSGNLCNHKPMGQPEATEPDLNRKQLKRISQTQERTLARGREAGSCLRLGNTSPHHTYFFGSQVPTHVTLEKAETLNLL